MSLVNQEDLFSKQDAKRLAVQEPVFPITRAFYNSNAATNANANAHN